MSIHLTCASSKVDVSSFICWGAITIIAAVKHVAACAHPTGQRKKMWTYKTIWNICISDFIVASLWIIGFLCKNNNNKKKIGHSQKTSQMMVYYSDENQIRANNMSDCQHTSHPSRPVHITERYSAKYSEKIFSFIGSLLHADKWHHLSGTRFKCTGCVCSPSQARPVGTTPSALNDRLQ